jgi:hypothetical protein
MTEVMMICATKATMIWEVRNVATVDGGTRLKDLIVRKKPEIPEINKKLFN